MHEYIYLHGFASSPQSKKAQFLRDRFSQQGITLKIPDLNQGDFTHLTLTRQIKQVHDLLAYTDTATLIGSSFGGLTAAWVAVHPNPVRIQQLILLAPAFNFLDHWLPKLGKDQLQQWEAEELLPVYHYGEERSLPLHYNFILDAKQYDETQLCPSIPTIIFHGCDDDVIPIQASHHYVNRCPWSRLIELNSDHSLDNGKFEIWEGIQNFLGADLKLPH